MGANSYIDAMPAAPPPEKLVADENRAMLEAARAQDLLAVLRAEVERVVGGGAAVLTTAAEGSNALVSVARKSSGCDGASAMSVSEVSDV